jgi:glycerophosphoryl diester phosphodiesterase
LTQDNVLICRHDRILSGSTDIADHAEFADRRVEKEGRNDWWAEDFTIAEIKTLRSRETYAHRSKLNDDKFAIVTFDEVIELVRRKSIETGRIVGIIPEPKQAEQHAASGKDITAALVTALERAGWTGADAPVIVQSFEADVLKKLNEQIDVPLIQLTLSKRRFDAEAAHESAIDLDTIPAYADGVGPSRLLVVHEDGTVTNFIEHAHALGLEVHVWTVHGDRDSPDGLSSEDETRRFYDLGIDALFVDDPALAVRVRDEPQGRKP